MIVFPRELAVALLHGDGEQRMSGEETPDVEHRWLSTIDFDGPFVHGVLLHAPNWLKTVKQPDIIPICDGYSAVEA